MAQETDTPPETKKAATQAAELPMARLTLLGTMIDEGSASALIRLPRGSVQKVEVGTVIGAARVAAIGEGELYLDRNGRAQKLTVPGS